MVTGAGADAVIGHLSVATLDPGDEVVTAWPSFISYVLDTLKLGAVPRKVPLVDDHYDLDALLAAIGPRTKLVYVATPNNPTGTMTTRDAARRLLRARPRARAHRPRPGLLRVHRPPGLPRRRRGVPARAAAACSCCARSRRSTGSPGCASATASGPPDVIQAIGKTRRAFDVNTQAQVAALASIDGAGRARRAAPADRTRDARTLERTLREHGLEPAGPAVANFLFVEVGEDAPALFDALLRQGAIVRPMGAFGAPGALRITVGTPDENAFFAEALASVTGGDDLSARLSWGPSRALAPAFPYADHAEERHRPRSGRQRQRPGRAAARRALADHDLPPAGAAAAFALGVRPHGPRLGRSSLLLVADRLGRRRRLPLVPPERRGRRRARLPT